MRPTTPVTSLLPTPTDPPGQWVAGANVVVEGPENGRTIALVHGVPGSVRDFRYLAPALVAQGIRAVRIDLPGFGKTPRIPLSTEGLRGRAIFLKTVMAALGIEKFAVGGHSFGGGVALLCAAEFPESVNAFVGMNSVGPRRHRGYAVPPVFVRAMGVSIDAPVIGSRIHRAILRAYKKQGLKSDNELDLATVKDQLVFVGSADFDELRRAALRVRVPALVVSARNDRLVDSRASFELFASLDSAPFRTHLIVQDGGHFVQKHEALAIAAWCHRHL